MFEKPGGNAITITGKYVVIGGLFIQDAANDQDIPYDLRGALLVFLGSKHNVIRNSEITSAGVGIRLCGQHHPVEHNTIFRDRRQSAVPLYTVLTYRESGPDPDASWVTLRNNIFYTLFEPVLDNSDYPFDYPHSHNLFFAPTSGLDDPNGYPLGPGDVIADPRFVDFHGRDLRLQPASPAVDVGTDLGYALDLDGNPVLTGAAPEAGVYEYQCDTGGSS